MSLLDNLAGRASITNPILSDWQYNTTGNVRRISASAIDGEPNYWGGAGAPQQYAYQKKDQSGNWTYANPGEHNEAATYWWAGVNTPQYQESYNDFLAGTADSLDLARIGYPEAVGQAAVRSEGSLTGGGNEDDWRQELAFYLANPQYAQLLSNYYTPEMRSAIQQQLNASTPEAQAARDTDDGLFGLGDIGTLLAISGLVYGGYSLLGGLGGAAGAAGTTTGLGASTAAAGLGTGTAAAGLGLGTSAVGMPLFTAAELAAAFPGLTAAELGSIGAALGGTAAAAGGSGMGWLDDLGFGNILGGDTSSLLNFDPQSWTQPNAWDFGPGNIGDDGWGFLPGAISDYGFDPISGMTLEQVSAGGMSLPSLSNLNSIKNLLTGTSGNLLGTGAGLFGSYLQGSAASDAASKAAAAQIEATKIAADAAKFKPVGVTSRFGTSQFGYDANGNLISAGYALAPDVKAQQDRLFGAMSPALDQYLSAQGATAPMGTAGQSAMELGQGYLATTPQEQAQKYMDEQQALLAASRERELANLRNKLAQEGRLGLATGATQSGMMASNPELEAYYNALMQQDLGLAAKATQGGMDYAKFGAGMVGTGGDLLKAMYGTQSAAYAPYQTALSGVSGLEGLGQQAMDLGVNIGAKGTAQSAQSGSLLAQGMQNAANIMQPANAYSPWGSLLSGAGQALQSYNQPQQYRFDPYTGQQVRWS